MDLQWKKHAPWFMTISSSAVLVGLAFFLVLNIGWFKLHAVDSTFWCTDPEFRLHIHHIHLSMIKRSAAMFSGFAALLIGSGVSLYSLESRTKVEGQGIGWSVKLATASPGIVAMLIGATLIGIGVYSKDSFPQYSRPDRQPSVLADSRSDSHSSVPSRPPYPFAEREKK